MFRMIDSIAHAAKASCLFLARPSSGVHPKHRWLSEGARTHAQCHILVCCRCKSCGVGLLSPGGSLQLVSVAPHFSVALQDEGKNPATTAKDAAKDTVNHDADSQHLDKTVCIQATPWWMEDKKYKK